MVQLGLFVWCILIIVICVCLLPWWWLPVTVGYFLLVELFKKH